MRQWKKLRQSLSRIAGGLLLMIAGAWLLSLYLGWSEPALAAASERTTHALNLALWIVFLVRQFLRPPEDRAGQTLREPAPRWSGAWVVLATGLAAAFFVGRSQSGSYGTAAIIVIGTLIGAGIVWRFATIHAAEIGEARFATGASGDRSGIGD